LNYSATPLQNFSTVCKTSSQKWKPQQTSFETVSSGEKVWRGYVIVVDVVSVGGVSVVVAFVVVVL
jgi:hypothetical protein